MKKVVFCEIAWMKYYSGVSEDDQPVNGGKYVKENKEVGEIYNFAPYNHQCYGYVMHQGEELHIERYDRSYGILMKYGMKFTRQLFCPLFRRFGVNIPTVNFCWYLL